MASWPGYDPAAQAAAAEAAMAAAAAGPGAAMGMGPGDAGFAPVAPAPGTADEATAMAAAAAAAAGAGAGAGAGAEGSPFTNTFGVVVPGRPVDTSFRQADANKFVIEIVDPGTVPEISVFLLPGVDFPAGMGVALYFAPPPFDAWQLLGTMRANALSDIFVTGWAAIDDVSTAPVVQLGLSIETDEYVSNLAGDKGDERDVAVKKDLALSIAKDLSTFMTSFATEHRLPTGEDALILPANVMDQWLAKFEVKYRRDQTFLKKA